MLEPGSKWIFTPDKTTFHPLLDPGDVVVATGEFDGQDRVVVLAGRNRGRNVGVFADSLTKLEAKETAS